MAGRPRKESLDLESAVAGPEAAEAKKEVKPLESEKVEVEKAQSLEDAQAERIAALEAQVQALLARESAAPLDSRTKEEAEAEAVRIVADDKVAKVSKPKTDDVVIHFVKDGLTAFGEIWRAGQELTIKRTSQKYLETVDREGNSWLDLNEEGQFKRWRKVYFRPGPVGTFALADAERIETENGKKPSGGIPLKVKFE